MDKLINQVGAGLSDFWRAILFSVDHMTFTQWCILGTVSVVIGFMLLKTQRF